MRNKLRIICFGMRGRITTELVHEWPKINSVDALDIVVLIIQKRRNI